MLSAGFFISEESDISSSSISFSLAALRSALIVLKTSEFILKSEPVSVDAPKVYPSFSSSSEVIRLSEYSMPALRASIDFLYFLSGTNFMNFGEITVKIINGTATSKIPNGL